MKMWSIWLAILKSEKRGLEAEKNKKNGDFIIDHMSLISFNYNSNSLSTFIEQPVSVINYLL